MSYTKKDQYWFDWGITSLIEKYRSLRSIASNLHVFTQKKHIFYEQTFPWFWHFAPFASALPCMQPENYWATELVKSYSTKELGDFGNKNNIIKLILTAKDSVDVYELTYETKYTDCNPQPVSLLPGYFLFPILKKGNFHYCATTMELKLEKNEVLPWMESNRYVLDLLRMAMRLLFPTMLA